MPKVSYERARHILGEILERKGVTDAYFSNIESNKNTSYIFTDKEGYEKGRNLLVDEFDWSKTSEGNAFWAEVFEEYCVKFNAEPEMSGDPFKVEYVEKATPEKECGLTHIKIGSNTWAFDQIANHGEKVRHEDDTKGDYTHFDGGCHLLDQDDDKIDFDQLADYKTGWSLYEEEQEED